MADKQWYTELWDSNGRAAKWRATLPDFASVHEVIMGSRRRATDEIVRVLAPFDAVRRDLDALEALGAQRF